MADSGRRMRHLDWMLEPLFVGSHLLLSMAFERRRLLGSAWKIFAGIIEDTGGSLLALGFKATRIVSWMQRGVIISCK